MVNVFNLEAMFFSGVPVQGTKLNLKCEIVNKYKYREMC